LKTIRFEPLIESEDRMTVFAGIAQEDAQTTVCGCAGWLHMLINSHLSARDMCIVPQYVVECKSVRA
jgi:hypothetical protein